MQAVSRPFGHTLCQSRSSREGSRQPSFPESWLRHWIDGSFLCLLFLAPLVMGGRHPVGQLVWMLIAAALGLGTLLHTRPQKPSPGDLLWLAAACLVFLQLIPLSPSLPCQLNPGLEELLPAINDHAKLPFAAQIYDWRPLSINPHRTRLALGMLLAYGVIFHAATQRLRSLHDVRRLLTWIATATVAISLLALAQRFAGNGKFLWIYQHVSRSASDVVKGPFQNQNHLAQLVALGISPLLYFATIGLGRWRTVAVSAGATACLLTGMLTFSRGGIIAIGAALLVTVAGLAYVRSFSRKHIVGLLLPLLLTGTLLGIWGGDRLLGRVQTLTSGADLSTVSASRLDLWQAHIKAIAASPWVGYGAASHEDIYPTFIAKDFGVNFTHGESGYLPIQLESGLPGTLLLAGLLGLALRWAWHSIQPTVPAFSTKGAAVVGKHDQEIRAMAVAVCGGLSASGIQSLVDFVWYIPACLTITLLLLACLYRLTTLKTDVPATPSAPVNQAWNLPWLAVPMTVLLVAITWSIGPARASHAWDEYHLLAETSTSLDAPRTSVDQSLPLLQTIIHHCPSDPVARLRLGAALIGRSKRFEEDREAAQEAAALAAQHALLGLRTAPLRGEGYLILEEALGELGIDHANELGLLTQAVRVRPVDTELRLHAGLAACRQGQIQWGLATWKPVMEVPSPKRDQLLIALAETLPTELIMASFSLDHTALSVLYNHHYRSHPRSSAARRPLGHALVDSLVQAASETAPSAEASGLLFKASFIHQQIHGPAEKTLELATRAVQVFPTGYRHRIWLTQLLINNGQKEEAQVHLEWCRLRKPNAPQTIRQEQLYSQAFVSPTAHRR